MSQRIIWIDALRVLAAMAVVWLHVGSQIFAETPDLNSFSWWTGNISGSAVRWCVPVFVMISGGLILPRAADIPIHSFYRKTVRRIGTPFLFWAIVYLIYQIILGKPLERIIDDCLLGRPHFHLWFMSMLLGLYIIAPFLARAIAVFDRTQLRVLTLILFVCMSAHMSLASLRDYIFPFDFFSLWVPYVPYFLMGHIVLSSPVLGRRIYWIGAFVLAIFLTAMLYAVSLKFVEENMARQLFYGYLSPLVILASICVMYMLHSVEAKWISRLAMFASFTLGVYLIHPLWIDILVGIGLSPDSNFWWPPILGIPVTALIVFVLSYLSCRLISYLPGGRRVVC